MLIRYTRHTIQLQIIMVVVKWCISVVKCYVAFKVLLKYVELRPCETVSHSATQEFPQILQNPKVHCGVHRSPPLVCILSQINSDHYTPSCLIMVFLMVSSGFPTKILYAFPFFFYYMPSPSHPPWLYHSDYTWWSVQVMKLLIMQIPPTSYHYISLQFKYSSQYPVLKHPKSMLFP
jgi:hypothetical protein